jgi:PilZ domain
MLNKRSKRDQGPRVAPRRTMILSAEVLEVSTRTKMSARTSDVSSTGCYIDTLNPMPIGTEVCVRLTHNAEVFEASGQVAYTSPGLGMGIAFHGVPDEEQKRLARWLAEESPFI